LVYLVREPFASRATGTTVAFGKIREREALEIISEMPEGGCISVDGVIEDLLEFSAGTVARFTVADRVISVVLP
ncbi:sugar kinase, partial [bacterium]|nr:sugar kinase [bacterium]